MPCEGQFDQDHTLTERRVPVRARLAFIWLEAWLIRAPIGGRPQSPSRARSGPNKRLLFSSIDHGRYLKDPQTGQVDAKENNFSATLVDSAFQKIAT